MNAKIVILALCALQVATGDVISDALKPLQAILTNLTSSVQTATTQYQGQLADSLKNATQQLKSQFESGLESFKQQINESYYSYKNASDGIKACLEEQEEKYTEVYNSTQQQDAAEYAQYNSSSGIEKLRNVTKSISDTVKQLPSDFSKCVGLGIFAALNIPTCVANAVTKITNLTSQLKDAIQAAGADTSSAISSFIAINKNATDQYRKIDQETYACVENAVSSSE